MARRLENDDDEDVTGGSAEELAIVKEEVVELVYRVMESHLKDQQWDEARVSDWISKISTEVMKGLVDQCRPYKFTGASVRRIVVPHLFTCWTHSCLVNRVAFADFPLHSAWLRRRINICVSMILWLFFTILIC